MYASCQDALQQLARRGWPLIAGGAIDPPPPEDASAAPPAEVPAPSASPSDSAASAPPVAAPNPALQQVQSDYSRLMQLEQALQMQEASERQTLQTYAQGMPPEQVQQMLAVYGQNAQQRAAALQQAQMARQALEVQAQRAMLEGPARLVTHHTLIQEAQKIDPTIDPKAMDQFLNRFKAAEDVVEGARAYLDLHRGATLKERAHAGTDRMGATHGTADTTRNGLSPEELIARALRKG